MTVICYRLMTCHDRLSPNLMIASHFHNVQRLLVSVIPLSGGEKSGLVRDLNPGPLAPKARIIPLDQRAIA